MHRMVLARRPLHTVTLKTNAAANMLVAGASTAQQNKQPERRGDTANVRAATPRSGEGWQAEKNCERARRCARIGCYGAILGTPEIQACENRVGGGVGGERQGEPARARRARMCALGRRSLEFRGRSEGRARGVA
jgi:hypothetical protein